MNKGPVSQFIEHNYRHFNAAALVDAAKGYEQHINEGESFSDGRAGHEMRAPATKGDAPRGRPMERRACISAPSLAQEVPRAPIKPLKCLDFRHLPGTGAWLLTFSDTAGRPAESYFPKGAKS